MTLPNNEPHFPHKCKRREIIRGENNGKEKHSSILKREEKLVSSQNYWEEGIRLGRPVAKDLTSGWRWEGMGGLTVRPADKMANPLPLRTVWDVQPESETRG